MNLGRYTLSKKHETLLAICRVLVQATDDLKILKSYNYLNFGSRLVDIINYVPTTMDIQKLDAINHNVEVIFAVEYTKAKLIRYGIGKPMYLHIFESMGISADYNLVDWDALGFDYEHQITQFTGQRIERVNDLYRLIEEESSTVRNV